MIDHLSIGTADIGRARTFYDVTLGALGYQCLSADASAVGYGRHGIALWVLASSAPVPANQASGLHICFVAPDSDSVRRFYDAALRHGGSDNGEPGIREDYGSGYYAAFVVDPDGYRIEAYCNVSG